VAPLIEEMVHTLQPAAAKTATQLRCASQVRFKRCAPMYQSQQILFNLLSNRCKFTDHGTISVDIDQSKLDGHEWVRFRVTDTGIGITASKSKICSRIPRRTPRLLESIGGTGLETRHHLQVRAVNERRISVESEPGKAPFSPWTCPPQVIAEAPEALVRSKSEQQLRCESKPTDTILVIDDDASVRDLTSRFLSKLGFQVVAAANGEEGIRLARQVQPLVITLDVIMPECDGWTVLKKLKSDPSLAEIPVIMVTIVDNEAMGIHLGASNYLIKPVDRDVLRC